MAAGVVAVNVLPLRSGKGAGRAQGPVCPGAVPTPPAAAGRGVPVAVPVNHDEPALLVLVGNVVQATAKILGSACTLVSKE